MTHIKNPCVGCVPPQRHAYCHCEGQCAKGDAYQKFVEYRRKLNEQNLLEQKERAFLKRDKRFSNRFDFKMRTN